MTTMLDHYGVYRLTPLVRERMAASLVEAGLQVDPPIEEVERYGTVRLSFEHDGGATASTDPVEVVGRAEEMMTALVWLPDEEPTPVDLMELFGETEGVVWLDVDVTRAEAATVSAALRVLLDDNISEAMVKDLLSADLGLTVDPDTGKTGIRSVVSFSVSASESDVSGDDADASKAGQLEFQLVEFLASLRWIVSCWHECTEVTGKADDLPRPPENHARVIEMVAKRWMLPGEGFRSGGDLGLMILHELAHTYTASRRVLYAWLDLWEKDFYDRLDRTEMNTLIDLRAEIAEFRKSLEALHRSGMSANPELIWFAGVTNLAEARRVEDLIERTLADLRALSESLLTSLNLVATVTASRQSEKAERFQEIIAAIAAVLFVPTLVATIYGANTRLPGEDRWSGFGYMFLAMAATAAMALLALKLWRDRQNRVEPAIERQAPQLPAPEVERESTPEEQGNAAAILFQHVASKAPGRTLELLEVFAKEELQTPSELGMRLTPSPDGRPVTKQQVRAILRNLARSEAYLETNGILRRRVVVKDFSDYDREGAGRYGVSPGDRKVLQEASNQAQITG